MMLESRRITFQERANENDLHMLNAALKTTMTLQLRRSTDVIYDFYGSLAFINVIARLQSPCGGE